MIICCTILNHVAVWCHWLTIVNAAWYLNDVFALNHVVLLLYMSSKLCALLIFFTTGDFPCSVFDIVLKRITIRGSIVGTRKDMEEALSFASRGIKSIISVCIDDLTDWWSNWLTDWLTKLVVGITVVTEAEELETRRHMDSDTLLITCRQI